MQIYRKLSVAARVSSAMNINMGFRPGGGPSMLRILHNFRICIAGRPPPPPHRSLANHISDGGGVPSSTNNKVIPKQLRRARKMRNYDYVSRDYETRNKCREDHRRRYFILARTPSSDGTESSAGSSAGGTAEGYGYRTIVVRRERFARVFPKPSTNE